MADRSIKVRLQAEVNDFVREMGKASTSLDDVVKKSGDSAGAANTSLGRLVQSANLQRDAWNQVGGSLAGVGAAALGLAGVVAKTGAAYNTLQQTSRAALTTTLGSAEAVNKQMDKLDAFARTSPFSKAVFITAQQQMLAFGVETERVVPYLSAINDAVAAAGGNNQTLAELSFIMAQISAAGKITGQDLMQFGQRGVNAAQLIGDQMGLTGAQVREAISKNAIDAGDALDALAAGMSESFAGASANVKNTMEGATDRVKAAWRDLSAGLMEGAVGPEGGGWLVDLTNEVADFLRWIDRLPDPVKNAGAVIGTLGGTAALAAGSFLLLAPRILDTLTAVRTLSPMISNFVRVAGPWAVALGIVGGAVSIVANQHKEAKQAAEEYAQALALGEGAAEAAVRETAARRLAAKDVVDALQELGVAETLAVDAATGNLDARREIVAAYDAEIARLQALADEEFAAGNVMADYTNQIDQNVLSRDLLLEKIDAEAKALGYSVEHQDEYQALLGDTAEATDEAADATFELTAALEEAKTKTVEFSDGTRQLAEDYAAWIEMVSGSSSAFVDLMSAYAAHAAAVAESAGVSGDAWRDYRGSVSETLADVMARLDEQIAAQRDWQTNMTLLTGRASQEMLDYLAQLGPEGAALVADLVDATDGELQGLEDRFRESGAIAGNDFADTLGATISVVAAVGAEMGEEAAKEAAEALASGESALQDVIDQYDLEAALDVDPSPAIQTALATIRNIEAMRASIPVNIAVRNLGQAPIATGGRVGDVAAQYGLAAGGSPRWVNQYGRVHGPGTPTSDSVSAAISRDEFVTRASSAAYYGYDAMYALNARSVERDNLRAALGLAASGSPAHAYTPTYQPSFAGAGVGGGEVHVHHHYGRDSITVQGIKTISQLERALERSDERAQQRGVRRG